MTHGTSHEKVRHRYQGGSPARRAIGTVRLLFEPKPYGPGVVRRKDGTYCAAHGVKLSAPVGRRPHYSNRRLPIWTRCPKCFPLTARHAAGIRHWWMVEAMGFGRY